MTKQAQPVKVALNGDGLPTKKRRGSMKTTGSLQVKKGYYYVVLRIPDRDGTQKQKWLSTGLKATQRNKTKAQVVLAAKLEELQGVVYSDKILFADWIDKWLDHHAKEVGEVTIQGYRQHIKKHIGPYFRECGVYLQEVRKADIQGYYDYLLERGLSANTVRHHKNVLYAALKYAVDEEIIVNNPAARADLPKVEKPVHTVYTLELLNKLLDAAKDEVIFPAVFIAVHFGLRRSEIAGLEWNAIDLEAQTLTVCKTVSKFSKEVISNRTKTKNSLRTLPIPDSLIPTFRQLRIKQAKERLAAGPDYVDGDWFCRFPDGNRFHPDYISRAFNKLLKKNGLPHISFHELRHTLASLLIETGSDLKRVSEILGHADIATTADLYGHLSANAKRNTLDSFCRTLHAV